MTDWQPIETAPSMRPVLVWAERYGMTTAYRSNSQYWDYKWFVSCSGLAIVPLTWNPTHWAPLPNPPEG
jgi:hypothetical protein